MSKFKTSLVLEGGGLRGAYTAGALSWLIDNNIEFDNAYGISTGAIYLATFLMKDKQKLFDISTKYINDDKSIGLKSFLRCGRIVDYDYLFNYLLKQVVGFKMSKMNESKTNGQIGIYVLEEGKTVYKDIKKCTFEQLKACTTLPILGKVVESDGKHLLDGGITKMIPIEKSIEDNCQRHLIITTKPENYVRKPAKSLIVWLMKKVYPNCENISKDYKIRHINYQKQIDLIKDLENKKEAVYIFPSQESNVTRLGGSFEDLQELYNLGYQDMERRKEEIFALLK